MLIPINGKEFGIPAFAANLATQGKRLQYGNVQVWFGQFIDPTNAGNLAKFRDADGKPVNPAVSTAAFGTQTILFRGNAEGFIIDQGTGGPFIKTGTITDYPPGP